MVTCKHFDEEQFNSVNTTNTVTALTLNKKEQWTVTEEQTVGLNTGVGDINTLPKPIRNRVELNRSHSVSDITILNWACNGTLKK